MPKPLSLLAKRVHGPSMRLMWLINYARVLNTQARAGKRARAKVKVRVSLE